MHAKVYWGADVPGSNHICKPSPQGCLAYRLHGGLGFSVSTDAKAMVTGRARGEWTRVGLHGNVADFQLAAKDGWCRSLVEAISWFCGFISQVWHLGGMVCFSMEDSGEIRNEGI